jgi:hypothetical protein
MYNLSSDIYQPMTCTTSVSLLIFTTGVAKPLNCGPVIT